MNPRDHRHVELLVPETNCVFLLILGCVRPMPSRLGTKEPGDMDRGKR